MHECNYFESVEMNEKQNSSKTYGEEYYIDIEAKKGFKVTSITYNVETGKISIFTEKVE